MMLSANRSANQWRRIRADLGGAGATKSLGKRFHGLQRLLDENFEENFAINFFKREIGRTPAAVRRQQRGELVIPR